MDNLGEEYYLFPQADWDLSDLDNQGFILDLGGGGEGVIGQLKGKEVVAIDFREEELLEAADGPLKIIMDARELKFLNESFHTATAFFTLMYIRKTEDQLKVFQEAWRVLKPGGMLHFWDVDISQIPETETKYFIVQLFYRIRDQVTETGYGMPWPDEPRGIDHYLDLTNQAGFTDCDPKRVGDTFYLCLKKQ